MPIMREDAYWIDKEWNQMQVHSLILFGTYPTSGRLINYYYYYYYYYYYCYFDEYTTLGAAVYTYSIKCNNYLE